MPDTNSTSKDVLTRHILIEEIRALLDTLHDRGFFLSVTMVSMDILDDVELLFVRRHLRDTLRSIGGTTR